ncbi:MAG: UDP-galactopyranose mutase [Pseudobutyrivibrio sp.]|nr:UDP-galactopyranose mutase [Pseudobutyrivibrio sp.]
MKEYDYLIVGAGLYGATFAYEATKRGKRVLVIDRRDHIAGNIYTRQEDDINVHVYGAHIFHTSDKRIWDYMNQFAEFNNYINSPVAVYGDELYNLPFNMNTFSKMWNIKTPAEAQAKIAEQIADLNITEPKNLEEQALSLVGRDVYEKLIKGYTQKQWGRPCDQLPAFIIKRLPLRFTYDNNYFNDRFQGIPMGGYTQIVEKMLSGCDVVLEQDYFDMVGGVENAPESFEGTLSDGSKVSWKKLIFTGQIDEYYNSCYGYLEYRSVRFETEKLEMENYQGNAVVNYTAANVPYTRIIEHKHFEFGKQPTTIISREYSSEWQPGVEPYYPVNNEKNNAVYQEYASRAASEKGVIFGGRLGQYKYYDMDKVVAAALDAVSVEFS